MFETNDIYNLYFDGVISQDQEVSFKKHIDKHQLDVELKNLLKMHYNFRTKNSYKLHKILLWFLYDTLGEYAVTVFFAEAEHPLGCEYQSKVDFYVDARGNFDYELKNILFLHDDHGSSDECIERIDEKSAGFDKDCRVKGNIKGMDIDAFVESVTAK